MTRTIALALLIGMAMGRAPGQESGERGEAMQVTKPSDREIVIKWTFNAPRKRVFDAMTQPERIKRWLQAKSMTLVECEVDLKVSGAWRQVFQRANGKKIELRGVYQEVSSPQRLVNTETYDFSPLKLLGDNGIRRRGRQDAAHLVPALSDNEGTRHRLRRRCREHR